MKRIAPVMITSLVLGCGGGGQPGEYLFGLTAAEIEQVALHYDSGADVGRVLEQMQAPFSCSRFGDLCEVAGEQGALEILQDAWDTGRAMLPRQEIEAIVGQQLEVARAAAAEQDDGEIGRVQQASKPYPAGLSCPFGSIADESNGMHRIAGKATISHLGFISVGRLSISHYYKFLGTWVKWPTGAKLCLTYNHSKVWDGVTTHSSSSADVCVTGKSEVKRSVYWWRPAGQYFRISGCGDYKNSTIKDCICKGSYVGPYLAPMLVTAVALPAS